MILANAITTYCLVMDGHEDETICEGFYDGTVYWVLGATALVLLLLWILAATDRRR